MPHSANRFVEEGFRAAAIRRARRLLDELLNLRAGNGKRQHARAFHFDSRHRCFQRALREEIAGAPHAREHRFERLQTAIVGNGNLVIRHARKVMRPGSGGQAGNELEWIVTGLSNPLHQTTRRSRQYRQDRHECPGSSCLPQIRHRQPPRRDPFQLRVTLFAELLSYVRQKLLPNPCVESNDQNPNAPHRP